MRTAVAELRSPFGTSYVGSVGIVMLSLWTLLSTAVLLFCLVDVWPAEATSPSGGTPPTDYQIWLFGLSLTVSRQVGLFVVVSASGALGASLHAVRSLYWYTGNRDLKWSWAPMYLLLPAVGAVLGTVFYIVLRGGLFSQQVNSTAASPYGFAAVAALVGLFSEQAIVKLKQVFSALLASAETGEDHFAAAVKIDSFVPNAGPPGTEVTITGSGFTGTIAVSFNKSLVRPTTVSDSELEVRVPDGATTGRIAVATSRGGAQSDKDFIVDDRLTRGTAGNPLAERPKRTKAPQESMGVP